MSRKDTRELRLEGVTYAFDREARSSLVRSDTRAGPDTFRARSLAERRTVCILALANPIDTWKKIAPYLIILDLVKFKPLTLDRRLSTRVIYARFRNLRLIGSIWTMRIKSFYVATSFEDEKVAEDQIQRNKFLSFNQCKYAIPSS